MKTRLVNYIDNAIDLSFPVAQPRVTIGRKDDNMIQLPHEKVSKHHGVILKTKTGWEIEDLGSTNGIVVNGQRIERTELKDGDRVKIGPYEFYFEVDVPSDDWVPSHIIDVSTQVQGQTIFETKPPKKP